MTDPRRTYFEERAAGWDATWKGAEKAERLAPILRACDLSRGRLLDLGTGTGILLPLLAERASGIVALDFARGMLAEARGKHGAMAAYVRADVHALPFAEGSFDAAVAFAAFPHFREKAHALREIARVLTPRGRLLILHLAGSRRIGSLHAEEGGAVGSDSLPPLRELEGMLASAGLARERLVDEDELYLALSSRSAGMK